MIKEVAMVSSEIKLIREREMNEESEKIVNRMKDPDAQLKLDSWAGRRGSFQCR